MRFHVLEGEKVYIVSMAFMVQWRQFLLGNETPPALIDNGPLLWPPRQRPRNGAPEVLTRYDSGFIDGDELPVLNPVITSQHHFCIVNEPLWIYLQKEYGGGPSLTEDNMPSKNPIFRDLRRDFLSLRARMEVVPDISGEEDDGEDDNDNDEEMEYSDAEE
ncbi:hypothetical protein HDU97_008764 [Phlyctochytrium planicorne]|nr:hypothetical protein HDU97_008764 [Phlyctochytrium planicorne]